MEKNVLVLESGGPAAISCIKIIKKNLNDIKIFAADMDLHSAGFQLSDVSLVVSPSNTKQYPQEIEEVVNRHNIDLIIPCFEYGYTELAKIDAPFVNDFSSAILCKDKLKFYKECTKLKLPVPKTYLLNKKAIDNTYPLYIKPRYGVGSRDNYKVESREQANAIMRYLEGKGDFLAQKFLVGKHWNVDVFADSNGFISSIERRDIKQKEGNCITVEVMSNSSLSNFAREVQEKLDIRSPFNLEVFEVEKENYIINEINVRFGGGIIFGALAGRDFVSYLITKDSKYLGPIERAIYTRYYKEILVT